MAGLVAVGGNLSIVLQTDHMKMVNQPRDELYTWVNLPILIGTIGVNSGAAVVIRFVCLCALCDGCSLQEEGRYRR